MIYLASPYSAPSDLTEQARYEAALKAVVFLMQKEHHVISPIVHNHYINVHLKDTGQDFGSWDFWKEYDTELLSLCTCMMVLKLPGWRESVGVTAEIEYCQRMSIPVLYLNPETYEIENAED